MKYFESLGIFIPQGCAERRGNKITGSYGQFTRSKKTLSFIQFLPLNLISPNIHINFPRLISIPLSWKGFIKIKAIPSCWSVILLEIVMMGLILWKIMSPSQEPLYPVSKLSYLSDRSESHEKLWIYENHI